MGETVFGVQVELVHRVSCDEWRSRRRCRGAAVSIRDRVTDRRNADAAKTRTRLSLAMVGRWATPRSRWMPPACASAGGRSGATCRCACSIGEFVAVLGANGSGKSTLLKALLGALALSAGRVEVLGRRAGDAAAAIGYLPQRRSFAPETRLRGVDVVRLGFDGDRWGCRWSFRGDVARRAPSRPGGASPRSSSWSAPAAMPSADRRAVGRRAAASADRPGARAPPRTAAAR